MSIVVTIYSDCSFFFFFWSCHGLLLKFHYARLRCACSIYITSFLYTMIILCCCFLGDTCSYGSKATQILELGVSEFYSIVPNSHVKSRVCFRVLSQISQRERL